MDQWVFGMEKVSSPSSSSSSSRRSAYLEALTQEIKKKLTRVCSFFLLIFLHRDLDFPIVVVARF